MVYRNIASGQIWMMYHLLFLCNRLLVSMLLKTDVFFLLILLFWMKGLELCYILVEQVQHFATSARIPNKQLIDIILSFNWCLNMVPQKFNECFWLCFLGAVMLLLHSHRYRFTGTVQYKKTQWKTFKFLLRNHVQAPIKWKNKVNPLLIWNPCTCWMKVYSQMFVAKPCTCSTRT